MINGLKSLSGFRRFWVVYEKMKGISGVYLLWEFLYWAFSQCVLKINND